MPVSPQHIAGAGEQEHADRQRKFQRCGRTETALGWSGAQSILADRPEGIAGASGHGADGAQMLALAIGTCLCDDLHYTEHRRGTKITALEVTIDLHMGGEPLLATSGDLRVRYGLGDGSDSGEIIAEALGNSMVGNSLRHGVAVNFRALGR